MKIGIMSMQRIINYGSFLQAWGLKHTLTRMGHTVEFVDYSVEPPISETTSLVRQRTQFWLRLVRLLNSDYRTKRKRDIRVNRIYTEFYNTFRERYLPLLGITEARNVCPKLDVLIIGSDEVFNCFQTNVEVGYSLELFGKRNKAKRLLSYAASFGTTTIGDIIKFGKEKELGELLARFDDLSVRDDNSASIVQRLIGRQAKVHIDPVLLYDFGSEMSDVNIDLTDYIILYSYCDRFSEEEAAAAREFARQKNKKLISLGFWQPCCDDYVSASPFEVLAYFSKADCVITDTFHGTVLAIKYNKPFVSFVRESNSEKMNDLLSRFGLVMRIVKDPDMLEETMEKDIDYLQVNRCICELQRDAITYLRHTLNDIT